MPRMTGMPIVVTVHDLAWHEAQAHAPAYARYYFGPFSLHRYRGAARIVVDSDFSRDRLLRILGDFDPTRVDVVYPGVAADFCGVPRSAGDGTTILAVGTVERRKNLEVLVRALPRLPVRATRRDRAAHAVRARMRATRAAFAGRRSRRDARIRDRARSFIELYERCAVAAVPSRYEGFGYAAAQALCAGVPCVVSDRSIAARGRGRRRASVDADDPNAWAGRSARALNGARGRCAPAGPRRRDRAFLVGDERAAHRERLRFVSRSVSRARQARRFRRRARRSDAADRLEPASGIVTIVTRTNPRAGTTYWRTL